MRLDGHYFEILLHRLIPLPLHSSPILVPRSDLRLEHLLLHRPQRALLQIRHAEHAQPAVRSSDQLAAWRDLAVVNGLLLGCSFGVGGSRHGDELRLGGFGVAFEVWARGGRLRAVADDAARGEAHFVVGVGLEFGEVGGSGFFV